MLTEILFVLLVLTVGTLMVVDVVRTPSETPHATDRTGYGAERPAAVPSPGPHAAAFSPEPARRVTTAPPPDLGPPGRPESISPPPGSEPRPGTEPAYRERPRARRASSDVGSRVALLAIIPAVAAAVVTLCVVRIVIVLNGTSIHSPISSVHDGAVVSVLVAGIILVIALALGLWLTIRAARFVLRPWQGLQAGTLQASGSSDQTGQPTDVFDQMRREISRLTANEVQLRAKLNAMFVNLSHRSRSLVERQIRLLGTLEHGEQDERRLANLAKMNRIAIHLYRNSENLLILAGQEPSTGSNQPVTLTYLAEAAASEIEEGERVSFDVQPDIAVRGPAAGDVVHLLAELMQNATSFSAADMPVRVTGHMLPTGGVLVDVSDRGIGMTAKEMAYANWQLENPPATDLDASKWMGLLVVARLAARHRIRVRLNQAESGGLTALVWLPDEVAIQGTAAWPLSDLGSRGPAHGLPEPPVDPGHAAGRTTPAARPAEFASGQANSPGASVGPRLAADADKRPAPAWPAAGARPAPWDEPQVAAPAGPPASPSAGSQVAAPAGPPVTAPAGQQVAAPAGQQVAAPAGPPVTAPAGPQVTAPAGSQVAAPAGAPVSAPAGPPVTAPAGAPVSAPAEQSATLPADQLVDPHAEQMITLQVDHAATLRPSGPGQPDAIAEDAGASGLPTRATADEAPPAGVIVPPAEDLARTAGLPIYDEVESAWFRSGRQAVGSPGPAAPAENGWSSPADQGWHAAQTVDAPASSGSTAAGLPRRQPNANLLPGSIPDKSRPVPTRSAAAARDRLAGLQRGVSEGRATAMEAAEPDGNDES